MGGWGETSVQRDQVCTTATVCVAVKRSIVNQQLTVVWYGGNRQKTHGLLLACESDVGTQNRGKRAYDAVTTMLDLHTSTASDSADSHATNSHAIEAVPTTILDGLTKTTDARQGMAWSAALDSIARNIERGSC
jgi:hypothetical protein